MIPVEVTPAPWHATGFWDWVDHWQTLIAGALAFAAGVGTVVVAMKVIAATREQTATTVRLDKHRRASEASAFHAMLAEATKRVIAEATWAKDNYAKKLEEKAGSSPEGFTVRHCITKGAFAELRAACVRQGSPLTGEFLNLERGIDNFALQFEYSPAKTMGALIPLGKHAGMSEQLSVIEDKATELGKKAVERGERLTVLSVL